MIKNAVKGGFLVEILLWFLCLTMVLLCFDQLRRYLNRTKVVYNSVSERRDYRIRVEKLKP